MKGECDKIFRNRKIGIYDGKRVFSRSKERIWGRRWWNKIAELKKIEQENRTIEAVQEFRRAARGSGYERRSLVEEFKWEMNEVIQWKLMETEWSSRSIEQWYEKVTNLDRH